MAYEPVNSSQYTCADSDACLLFWEVFTPFLFFLVLFYATAINKLFLLATLLQKLVSFTNL